MNDLPDVPSDTGLKRRHRAHQGQWRESLGWPPGPPGDKRSRERYGVLTNYLAEEHGGLTPEQAGVNLVPPSAAEYARARLAQLKEIDGVAESDRLWRNLLSSQPLAFSIAGHLRDHRDEAAKVFATLTGLNVVGFTRLEDPAAPQYTLDGIEAEWFPPRSHHTRDRSGFDIAAMLALAGGTHALLTIEVKYVDSFSAKKLDPTRYAAALECAGIALKDACSLIEAGGSQFLRSVLLTDSVRRRGVAGSSNTRVDSSVAVVLGRSDDTMAQHVVELSDQLQLPVRVAYWSHQDFCDAAAREPSIAGWAAQMADRYVMQPEQCPSGATRSNSV